MTEKATALVVPRHGGVDVLEVHRREVDGPAAGEVQVRVAAVGVNFIDVYQREGVYAVPTPFVACNEGAGEVVAVAEGVADLSTGDRVAWGQHRGSGASVVNLPATACVPVPDGVDLETAAAAMLQGMTADYLVTDVHPIRQGEVALVHAAAGGVGQLLTQMIVARGGTVIATAGSAQKRATATTRGAAHVIDYTSVADLAAAVREANGGDGVHVVYDGVGKDTFDASLASLRARGMMALFGGASGQVPPVDLQRLNAGGSLFVTRPTLGDYLASRMELLERAERVLGAVAAGDLQIEIGGRYPLAGAARAYADLESRASQGKLLLIP